MLRNFYSAVQTINKTDGLFFCFLALCYASAEAECYEWNTEVREGRYGGAAGEECVGRAGMRIYTLH